MPENLKNDGERTDRPKEGLANIFDEIDRRVGDIIPGREADVDVNRLKTGYSIIEALLKVSASINSTMNLKDLLHLIVGAVVRTTGCKRGVLLLKDEGGGLSPALGLSKDGKPLPETSFDLSVSVIQKVVRTGHPELVCNAREEADLRDQRSILDLNIHTVICIPLEFEENLVGVIYADSDTVTEKITEAELSVLDAFGAQAAVAIENSRRHGELERIKNSLELQNVKLRNELAERYEFSGIIGRSPAMQRVFDVIQKVAPLSTTVLIQGETGTGKELIAKAIHYNSERKDRPLVSVNCGALPKDILESELFGSVKGAFTGADRDRAGLFESADGGTIFLDEIGEMPTDLQVKLLRVLQEGEIRRLGEETSRTVDVRVIAATNRDLAAEVEKGTFRNDLFYRLNVVPIYLPPLRERAEDILPLADFFVDRFSKQMERPKPILTRTAKELLLEHRWSGNVRELENAIERALALGEGSRTIDVEQFEHFASKEPNGVPAGNLPLKAVLLEYEKRYLRKMLVQHSWNVSRTANTLQISRQQLHSKIKKHGLTPEI